MVGAQSLFENEVHHLMRLRHSNIVRLMGYCYETKKVILEYRGENVFAERSEMLLCLEYLPKGSLDDYISGMTIQYRRCIASKFFVFLRDCSLRGLSVAPNC